MHLKLFFKPCVLLLLVFERYLEIEYDDGMLNKSLNKYFLFNLKKYHHQSNSSNIFTFIKP